MMIAMYFLTLNAIKNEDEQKTLVVLMCLVVFFISFRSFRAYTGGASYSNESRYDGPFWIVGLGSNHLGAFIAQYSSVFLGLSFFDNEKRKRLLYLATVLLGLHPLFFSYSRGAYIAFLAVLVFMGAIKKRILLISVLIIVLFWQSLLPASVVDRIQMTEKQDGELEHSSALRLVLWDLAIDVFEKNPLFGVGFGGFGYAVPDEYRGRDAHNIYLKMLSEQGVIGFTLLVLVYLKSYLSGWKLFRIGNSRFQKGLGFGLLGCVTACIVTNMFGDRWSYIELGTYFWIFWGLVDRGILISEGAAVGTKAYAGLTGNL